MTHHESFPGRPRGRRARSDHDVPEWAGYDTVPQDEREFPDLSPIRGRDARARDGRVQRDWAPDAELPGAGVAGQASQGRPPWDDQSWAAPPVAPVAPPAPAGAPPPEPSRQRHAQSRRAQSRHAQPEPDWAGAADADPMEAFSERWHRRGSDSREERRADRRKHRRLLIAGGAAAAVVIAVAVYFLTGTSSTPVNPDLGSLITTFLPGEIRTVPNACTAVPAATLGQYLPGERQMAAPPLNTGANSQCTWTLDKPPLYRVLEVTIEAYSPSALVSYGDGSATFAAMNAYSQYESDKQDPGAHSGQPAATITTLSGMPGGNDTDAFEAAQVFNVSGATTDMATVVVRYRNVIVTVVLNGLDHANAGNYGPVSQSALDSAAQTVAQQVTSTLVR